jgi:hypothetical protein
MGARTDIVDTVVDDGVRRGDGGIEELRLPSAPAAVRLAFLITGDAYPAEDITQEAAWEGTWTGGIARDGAGGILHEILRGTGAYNGLTYERSGWFSPADPDGMLGTPITVTGWIEATDGSPWSARLARHRRTSRSPSSERAPSSGSGRGRWRCPIPG